MVSVRCGKHKADTHDYKNNFPSSAWETSMSQISILGPGHSASYSMDFRQ